MVERVPFDLVAGQFVRAPVRLDGQRDARFLIDTGIGVTTLTAPLLGELGARPTGGTFVGHRMSGQAISLPLYTLGQLAVGGRVQRNPVVGAFDLPTLTSEDRSFEGILSLGICEHLPMTLDFRRRILELAGPDEPTPASPEGWNVPVEIEVDGPSIAMFLDLELPSGRHARVEVDTGSRLLILHEKFMPELGVRPGSSDVEVLEGTDETGHHYRRYRGRLAGAIAPVHAPAAAQLDPGVIFQEIIYDGLVGLDFLQAFVATYDVAGRRLVLAPATAQ